MERSSFASDAGVLLSPDLNAIVTRVIQLYGQVGDAAAKQLTQARPAASPTASPGPSPTPSPSPSPTARP